ncbi:hypothetical protein [Streptomyces canus]|uniref:hypothetical protein n=1 Tax=Streptomyces canus TaxID=58343 RepID=UPI003CEB2F41
MNVTLPCTARGHRLGEPLRPLPARPRHGGRKNSDGSRHAQSTVPQGSCAVGPEPSGAPYVPRPDRERPDAVSVAAV